MSTPVKRIEDYLHYYLGCDFYYTEVGHVYRLTEGWLKEFAEFKNYEGIKPILRSLSDISSTELKELAEVGDEYIYKDDEEKIHVGKEYLKAAGLFASQFHYLLSKGFDLFGLIEAGLAIDKSKIKEP